MAGELANMLLDGVAVGVTTDPKIPPDGGGVDVFVAKMFEEGLADAPLKIFPKLLD